MDELPLTVTEAAQRLRRGDTTSTELLRVAASRADAYDEVLGVYLARFDETARAAAVEADAELARGDDRGPLHGIPIGVKDILTTSEGPTTAQSLVHDWTWGAGKDAPAVARLREAGAVITGKLTTMEFAIGLPDSTRPFPLPRNPWDVARWTGGSSSGSGAGVAAGFFLAALGSDTGGSIRIPAAYCGVSGLKPTFGRVPNTGCVPLGYSLDHVGPLARSAEDCGHIFAVLAGDHATGSHSSRRAISASCARLDGGLDGVRVGVERRNHFGVGDDPQVAAYFDVALEQLRELGAHIGDVVIPHYAETVTALNVTVLAEGLAYHREDLRRRWSDYFASTRATFAAGALISAADYVQAQRVRRLAQRTLGRLLEEVDVIATPTCMAAAPSYEAIQRDGMDAVLGAYRTLYWNAVGNPVLALPMGFSNEGLPLSMQLAARPHEEALLVRVGAAYQRMSDWHLRRPRVPSQAVPISLTRHGRPDLPATDAGDAAGAVAVRIAEAGLTPSPEELARLARRYPAFRDDVDALYTIPEVKYELPALAFSATASPDLW